MNENNVIDCTDVNVFLQYFNSYYGENGMYPMRTVSKEELIKAIYKRKADKPNAPFDGDTFDRELIRDLIFTDDEQARGYNCSVKDLRESLFYSL